MLCSIFQMGQSGSASVVVCWQNFETATPGGVASCHPKPERTKPPRSKKRALSMFSSWGRGVLTVLWYAGNFEKQCELVLLLVILNLEEQSPPEKNADCGFCMVSQDRGLCSSRGLVPAQGVFQPLACSSPGRFLARGLFQLEALSSNGWVPGTSL